MLPYSHLVADPGTKNIQSQSNGFGTFVQSAAYSDVAESSLHPLAGKTKILYNTFVTSDCPEDKWVSFAETDAPPGADAAQYWLRATYTKVGDAVPLRFHAVEGKKDVYTLQNMWPGESGYVCTIAALVYSSYTFLSSNCAASEATQLRVSVPDSRKPDIWVMQTLDNLYVSFCTSGCDGGKWLATSYPSLKDAMLLKLACITDTRCVL